MELIEERPELHVCSIFQIKTQLFFQMLNDVPLEGDITVPGAPPEKDDQEFSTLDEPVRETIVSLE
jgi:hypothetical protein